APAGHEPAYPAGPAAPAARPWDSPADEPSFGARPGGPRPSPAPVGTGPGGSGQRRSRWPLLALVVLLAAGGAIAALLILRSSHAHPAAASPAGAPQSPPRPSPLSPTATPSPQSAQQRAADGLAGLLAQSVTDRGSIVKAVSDVSRCGPGLSQDPQVFQSAA